MGRPLNPKHFGKPLVYTEASATYTTNNEVKRTSDILVSINDAGSGYENNFVVKVYDEFSDGFFVVQFEIDTETTSISNGKVISFSGSISEVSNRSIVMPDQEINTKILGLAHIEGDNEPAMCYIINQKTSVHYNVARIDNPNIKGLCSTTSNNPPSEGEIVIEVSPNGTDIEHAKIIFSKRVKTFEGGVWAWSELDL